MEKLQPYPRSVQVFVSVACIAVMGVAGFAIYFNSLRATPPQVNEVARTCSQDAARRKYILDTKGPGGMPDDFGMHRMYTPDRSTIFFWYCDSDLKPILDGMRKGDQWFSRETVASDKELVSAFERILFFTWRTENGVSRQPR